MSDDLRDLYQDVILDHGKHPRNFRRPDEANRHAHGDNPICGDKVDVYLTVGPDGTISDVAFQGRGCAISQASASLMTEVLTGRSAAEADALFERFRDLCGGDDEKAHAAAESGDPAIERLRVLAGVREFPMRVKCATLAWHAMAAALHGDEYATSEWLEGDQG